jgi:hypothetical protein
MELVATTTAIIAITIILSLNRSFTVYLLDVPVSSGESPYRRIPQRTAEKQDIPALAPAASEGVIPITDKPTTDAGNTLPTARRASPARGNG